MNLRAHGVLGIEGRIRIVKHDVRGLQGSGPGGAVEYEDLWEHLPDGTRRSRYPERVTEDREIRNKFTRRGLGYLMYCAFWSNSGSAQSKQPSEILANWSTNPFLAFMLFGDDGAVPSRRGDAKVLWAESDGSSDDKIPGNPPGSGTVAYGRRGILLSATTGIFKRVQLRYPNASPDYEYNEMTFFAQANSPAVETTDVGLDNFVAKSIGLSADVACGYNEANPFIGTRAVIGQLPSIFGALTTGAKAGNLSDRVYKHENFTYGDGSALGLGSATALHKFVLGETIANGLPGYIASSEIADVNLWSSPAPENITFNNTDKTILLGTGTPFVAATHTRKTITTDAALNPGPFTIKRVINNNKVEVFEAVVAEGPVSKTLNILTRTTGDKAFDGRVDNEMWVSKNAEDGDTPGAIIQGEKYVSNDVAGPHYIGRIWAKDDARTIRGVRIVFPKGSIRDFCPKFFTIQTLNALHEFGGDPQPFHANDWTTKLDYSASDQSNNIFNNGEYGYEYTFTTAVPTCGIKISGIVPVDTARKVEIAELYVFEDMPSKTIDSTNNKLRLSVDGGSSYKTFTIPNVAATTSTQTLADAINQALYGWGLEAYRSAFGFVVVRGTVAGNYSQVHLDTVANAINSLLGIPTAGLPKGYTGVTQPFTKAAADAVTFIYTQRMGGNFPKPA